MAITGSLGVSDAGVEALLRGLRAVRVLDLSKCCCITDRWMETCRLNAGVIRKGVVCTCTRCRGGGL